MRHLGFAALVLILSGCGAAARSAELPTAAPTTVAPTQAARATTDSRPAPGTVEGVAAQKAVQTLGLEANRLMVVNKSAQEWPTSALGCPASDVMYMQVITPGFIVMLSDGSRQIEVHTDQSGKLAVVCENGRPVAER